jgi:Mg2+ and Co2+ transporter CorA
MTEQENKNDLVYSYHTFMFPFRWISENIKLEKEGWGYRKFDITKSCEAYNEYYYFHEFVQRALYNESDHVDNNDPSAYYEKSEYEGQLFEFTIKNRNNPLTLIIDGVSLRTFETGVGILSINLKNIEHRNFEDVLLINDFGRRLYPQFLAKPTNGNYADEAQNVFYPLTVKFGSMPKEKFSISAINKINLPEYITNLISPENKSLDIKPLLDDRMFVISHVMDNDISENMKKDYKKDLLWYKYVFADSYSLNCQNDVMRKSLIEQSTYDRWSDYGTLYGITRYSFVCLSDNSDFSYDVINQHIRRHYFQMMSLVLAVRASIIHFSDKVTNISTIASEKKLSDEVSRFYKMYIQFVNRIYFREISPQEQGIELYTKALEIMQIEKNIKDLDQEIAELFHYSDMRKQSEQNSYMANLSEKGIPLMVTGLIAGIFGMNTINYEEYCWSIWNGITAVASIGILYFAWKYRWIDKLLKVQGK